MTTLSTAQLARSTDPIAMALRAEVARRGELECDALIAEWTTAERLDRFLEDGVSHAAEVRQEALNMLAGYVVTGDVTAVVASTAIEYLPAELRALLADQPTTPTL